MDMAEYGRWQGKSYLLEYSCMVGADGKPQFHGTQWVARTISFISACLNVSEVVVGASGRIL
eukprot:3116993-Pyramimonas_sp.AAC.1